MADTPTPEEVAAGCVVEDDDCHASIDRGRTEAAIAAALRAAEARGAAAMREACKAVAEAERMKILENPADPSWTEHLWDVQTAMDALPLPPVSSRAPPA